MKIIYSDSKLESALQHFGDLTLIGNFFNKEVNKINYIH